jgi:hypothetical protein
VARPEAALLPEAAQKSAVAAVAHGSGTVVLSASHGTPTAQKRPTSASVMCARHTTARRPLNTAARL